MLNFVFDIAKTVTGGWLERKKAKNNAEVRAMDSVIDWESYMAKASESSWKDEFWTILLAIPLITAFIPGMSQYTKEGFLTIENMPEWYRYYVGLATSAAFGVRQLKKLIGRKNKK